MYNSVIDNFQNLHYYYVFIDEYDGTADVCVCVWLCTYPAMPIETKSVESQHHPVYVSIIFSFETSQFESIGLLCILLYIIPMEIKSIES